MEKLEMAEKLVEKCGISYEEAGDVLREANFDLLEAMIILEKRGRTGEARNTFSTGIPKDKYKQSKTAADAESFGEFVKIASGKIGDRLNEILKYQAIVTKGDREVMRMPFVLAAVIICATGGVAFGAVLISLGAGCSYTVRKE